MVEPSNSTDEPRCAQILATFAGKVKLAGFQNAVPVRRELSMLNEADSDVEGLWLTVPSEPAFLEPETWHINRLGAGQTVRGAGQTIRTSPLDLSLDGALLGRLTEVVGRIRNKPAGGIE